MIYYNFLLSKLYFTIKYGLHLKVLYRNCITSLHMYFLTKLNALMINIMGKNIGRS